MSGTAGRTVVEIAKTEPARTTRWPHQETYCFGTAGWGRRVP